MPLASGRPTPVDAPYIVFTTTLDLAETADVLKWINRNTSAQVFIAGGGYVFDSIEDATAFKLAFGGRLVQKDLREETPCS